LQVFICREIEYKTGMRIYWIVLLLPQLSWAQVDLVSLSKRYSLKSNKQSVCYKTPAGEIVGLSEDNVIIPASVSKLYSSFVAIQALGLNHQFETKFRVDQQADKISLTIMGDFDGYFVLEHLFFILSKLNKMGVKRIDEVLFDQKFYLNFYLDHPSIKSELLKYLNTKNWDLKIQNWYRQTAQTAQNYAIEMDAQLPSMQVSKVIYTSNLNTDNMTFSIKSAPLFKHLKEMNIYSNNYYAEALFQKIGSQKFNHVLLQALEASAQQLRFINGSGLPGNYTTCRLTLKLIDLLKKELQIEDLAFQNIASLAGVDNGTLLTRFRSIESSNAVIAKTGTLPRLSISTLAGVINTREGEIDFAIFNHYQASTVEKAKQFQQEVVERIIETQHGKEEYLPNKWSFFALEDMQVL